MTVLVATAAGGTFNSSTTWSPAQAPTAADDCVLDGQSGAVTIGAIGSNVCRSLDCSGAGGNGNPYTSALAHTMSVTLTIGDGTAGANNVAFRLSAGMTYTLGSATSAALSFVSTSATVQTITSNGKTLGNVTFNAASNGSWQLADAVTMGATATLTLTKGTLDTNGKAVSVGIVVANSGSTSALTLGASTITITGAGTPWQLGATTTTLSAAASTIVISGASASTRSMILSAPSETKTYGAITYTVAGSTGTLQLGNGNAIIGQLNFSDATNARTLRFTSSKTYTISCWNVFGLSGKLMTVNALTANTAFTLSKPNGDVVTDFLAIKDMTVSGGVRFYAGANSTNTSGNTGIVFVQGPRPKWGLPIAA